MSIIFDISACLTAVQSVKVFVVTEDDFLIAFSVIDAQRLFASARVESKAPGACVFVCARMCVPCLDVCARMRSCVC